MNTGDTSPDSSDIGLRSSSMSNLLHSSVDVDSTLSEIESSILLGVDILKLEESGVLVLPALATLVSGEDSAYVETEEKG